MFGIAPYLRYSTVSHDLSAELLYKWNVVRRDQFFKKTYTVLLYCEFQRGAAEAAENRKEIVFSPFLSAHCVSALKSKNSD